MSTVILYFCIGITILLVLGDTRRISFTFDSFAYSLSFSNLLAHQIYVRMGQIHAIELFPLEEKLLGFKGDSIVLTTHRIQVTVKDWGSSNATVIFLEDIASIEERYVSQFLLLVLAVLGVLGGFYMQTKDDASSLGFGLAAVFGGAWWLTRRRVIRVASKGGSHVNFELYRDQLGPFFQKIQAAKAARVSQLCKGEMVSSLL